VQITAQESETRKRPGDASLYHCRTTSLLSSRRRTRAQRHTIAMNTLFHCYIATFVALMLSVSCDSLAVAAEACTIVVLIPKQQYPNQCARVDKKRTKVERGVRREVDWNGR